MICTFLPTAILFAVLATAVYGSWAAPEPEKRNDNDFRDVCAEISVAISAQSEVFYPGKSSE